MSNITASSYTTDAPQIDGRFWVHETHVDVAGLAHTVDWLADPSADLGANLVAHASTISQTLHDGEVSANLSAIMAQGALAQLTNVYSSVADNVAAVQAAYPQMSVGEALMVANYLVAQTDQVLEAAYGMTADQVAALRAMPTLAEQEAAIAAVVN